MTDEIARLRELLAKAAPGPDQYGSYSHWEARQELRTLAEDALPALLDRLEAAQRRVGKLEGALIWCSGSADFAPEGKAREGWERIAQPLIGEEE